MHLSRRTLIKSVAATAVASQLPHAWAAESPAFTPGKTMMINGVGWIDDINRRYDDSIPQYSKRTFDDLKASGMTATNLTLGYVFGDRDPFEESVQNIGEWDVRIREYDQHLVKVLDSRDIVRAQSEGKCGVIYGFQNCAMMGDNVDRVDMFANLGVRSFQLTYNIRNQLGDGSMVPENKGLTPFGRDVVARLNDLKMLVDLSHSGEQTCLDAIAASKGPIAIGHTGCRALSDLPRNKTDVELKNLADKGGVAGIYFMPFLLPKGQPDASNVVAHIEHAINVCGEDHVGIGTDGVITAPDNWDAYRANVRKEILNRRKMGVGAKGETVDIVPLIPDLTGPTQFAKLADMLKKRGHSQARIDKVMGGNFFRLMRDVWGA